MVRFAHIADCHLGSWRQDELQYLNFDSFKKIIDIITEESLDFVLLSGDLFDSAYPPIEILKKAFAEFRRLRDKNIPVYLIAGSHDYSASGRTFLDVLEKAGFCEIVEKYEVDEEQKINLIPTVHGEIGIYGYSGKKSSMELEDLKKISLKDNNFKYTILMLHTTLSDVVSNIDMNSVNKEDLPIADYYAMGHIHQRLVIKDRGSHFVYPGPSYPNNFQELADLKQGSFQISEIDEKTKTINLTIPTKEIVYLEVELTNGLSASEEIIERIDKCNLVDKILLLKLKGVLTTGKSGDIRFNEIEEFIKKKKAYSFLRNINQLKNKDSDLSVDSGHVENVEEIERIIQEEFSLENPHDFNKFLPQLMNSLSLEKNEDERSIHFEARLIDEIKKILNIDGEL